MDIYGEYQVPCRNYIDSLGINIFGNFGKLLYESINIYGQKLDKNNIYYHGLNKLFNFSKYNYINWWATLIILFYK